MRLHLAIALAFSCAALLAPASHARNFRVARIPNGTLASCANCHVNPGGGAARTPFGDAVHAATGGSTANVPFWDATLAALDSDGDGLTNGAELLDPDGDGTPAGSTGVTNPGNRPPTFTSTPMATAAMGLAYAYTATATDAETNVFTFSKVAGPAWLAVSSAGAVSGLPPAGSSGWQSVTIRVADAASTGKGYSLGSTTQTYGLNVISSYAGWQALNFTLPADAALAAPLADPDFDGLANVLEYAVRSAPRSASAPVLAPSASPAAGHLVLILNVRDDDPKLTVVMEAAADPTFANLTTIAPVITDPVPDDGLEEYRFTDTITSAEAAARYVRLRASLAP